MSNSLENAIQAISSGIPDRVKEANGFLIAFVESDEAWQPALDLVQNSTNDFVSSFASNFLYTKIRKHWNKLNEEQRQGVFNVLRTKLNQLAGHRTNVNRLVINRISLALLCICSRISKGVSAFSAQAFAFFNSPEFQGVGNGPKLIALEMLAIVPPEIAQLDVSREVRLELEQEVLDLLTPVLQLLQMTVGAAGAMPAAEGIALRSTVSGVLFGWLSAGVTIDALYTDYRSLMQFLIIELSCETPDNIKKACSIVSKLMTMKEHPRPGSRDEVVYWLMGELVRAAPSFSIYFGSDGDNDVAFDLIDCIVSVVVAELPFLSRPDKFQLSIFDLLLTFLSQKPRKLGAITFEIWCNLEDVPTRERHPFLTGQGDQTLGASVYTRVLEVLLMQCVYRDDDTSDPEDISDFRDGRQGIQEVFVACYEANPMAFMETMNGALQSCNCASGHPPTDRSSYLESIFHAINLTIGCMQEDVKNKTRVSGAVLAFLRVAMETMFAVVTDMASGDRTHILLTTVCNFLGSCTFLLTCTDADTVVLRQQDFAAMFFSPALSFLFQALLFPNTDVAMSAAKSILKLTTQGKALLLVPYVEEMSLLQTMIQLLSPLLVQTPTSASGSHTEGGPVSSDSAVLVVLEAVIRLLAQLPPRLADSYISSIGSIVVEQLDRSVYAAAQAGGTGAASHSGLESAVVRPQQHLAKIIKFCDVLFMPPLPSPGKREETIKPVEVLLPFLGSVWVALQRAEDVCLKLGFLQAIDEMFSVYSGILFSCRDIVATSQLPRLGQFIVSVFKEFRRASAANCATSAIESLVILGPEVWSVFFVPLVGSMVMSLPGPGSAAAVWAAWACAEEDTTGGALEAYLKLIHRCVMLCPDVMLTQFSTDTPNGRVTFEPFDLVAGHIFSILSSCRELAPLRATLLLVQCLFSCPTSPQVVDDPSQLSKDTVTSRDCIVSRSIERIGQGVCHYILHGVGQQTLPSMLWTLATDTLSSIVASSYGNAKAAQSEECRKWFITLLSDPTILPLIPPDYRSIILEVLVQYPISEKRRFKLFMQDLNKICASEQGPETLLDYTISS